MITFLTLFLGLFSALDLDRIHFLTAEVYFANGTVARAERVFGSDRGTEIDTGNTAVAVEVEGRRRLRRAEQAEGLLEVGGEPVEVLAVEQGPAEFLIVRERSAFRELALLTATLQTAHFGSLSFGEWSGDRVFLVSPAPRHQLAGAAGHLLYAISPALPGERGNLLHWLVNEHFDPEAFSLQELPDAVALATEVAIVPGAGARPAGTAD